MKQIFMNVVIGALRVQTVFESNFAILDDLVFGPKLEFKEPFRYCTGPQALEVWPFNTPKISK